MTIAAATCLNSACDDCSAAEPAAAEEAAAEEEAEAEPAVEEAGTLIAAQGLGCCASAIRAAEKRSERERDSAR